ncbi:MAG TPA: NAD(P)H-dependent oxidoreductase [Solirubrobacteraceae bacterium]|nr:NAD(P)H-dependent oxidoreductase [Solirubrobacteraceae bacterium]
MAEAPRVLVIIASTRQERRGEPIARWFTEYARTRSDVSVELADLALLDLPPLRESTPPMHADSRDAGAADWSRMVAEADAFVVVCGEYNHGYPAPLKNAFDHLFSEWARKPVGFVSYGGAAGGVRAVEQLRQVAVELDMVPVRRQVAIHRVWAAFGADGQLSDPPREDASLLLDDVVWWADTLRGARAAA